MSTFRGMALGLTLGAWEAKSEQLESLHPSLNFSVAFNVGPPAPTSEQLDDDIDDYFHSRGYAYAVASRDDGQCVPSPHVPSSSLKVTTVSPGQRVSLEPRVIWSNRVGM